MGQKAANFIHLNRSFSRFIFQSRLPQLHSHKNIERYNQLYHSFIVLKTNANINARNKNKVS